MIYWVIAGFTIGFAASSLFLQPLAWRIFRGAHKNNPEALAFADRQQGK